MSHEKRLATAVARGLASLRGVVRTSLAIAVLVAAWGEATAAPAAAAGTYVAVGDSLTAGNGAPPGQGFVDRFFAYLRSPAGGGLNELSRYNVGGASAESMLTNRQSGLGQALGAIGAASNTRVVSIQIGAHEIDIGNGPSCDAARGGGFNATGCSFGRSYASILRRVKAALAADPGPEQLIVVTYYNPATGKRDGQESPYDLREWGTDGRLDCAGRGLQLGLNDLIICIGLREAAAVADVYPRFKVGGQSLINPGDVHANPAGYAVMARVLVDATRPTRLTLLRVRPGSFRSATSGPTASARVGATVSYSLSRADQVAFRVEQRRGSRWVALGPSFTRVGEPGPNSFKFSGRIRGRRLAPGQYRLLATASAAKKGTRPARAAFAIAK